MVDYRKASTGSTDLVIRDTGTSVEFWIDCDSTSTFFGSPRTWSGRVNGVNVDGGFTWASGGGMRRIAGPWPVSSTQDVTFAIGDTGTAGMGGPTSFTQRITRALPGAPSGLNVTYVSDSQQTLTWTRHGTYTSVVVQRRTNDGAWQQVGVASGNAATYTDKTTEANRKYQYRVAGRNDAGLSGWSNTDLVYTTPVAPSGVSATRVGDDISVTASAWPYADSFEVRDGETVVGSGSLPILHVDPNPAAPHTYTMRAHVGGRTSPWSSPSNTVQLISPPNAPTSLAPNGSVWASDTDVLFKWKHNPVDSSPQTAFEMQYRIDGGAWVTVTGTTASQVSVTLDVASVDWQVRTKGSHPDWSPWSSVATFTIIDRPGVAIVQPADTWDASILLIEWTWFQAQGRPQSAWRFELLDAANNVVEARNGSGPQTAPQASTRLTEGTWTVRAQAATGEVWSLWATETFTVTFDPPGAPVISGEWDETQGGVQLAVAGEAYGVAVLTGGIWYAEIGE